MGTHSASALAGHCCCVFVIVVVVVVLVLVKGWKAETCDGLLEIGHRRFLNAT